LLRIYRLHLQQKSEKRYIECHEKLYCLQKIKQIKYKQIKRYVSANDSNEFAKIVDSYYRLCESIHKKCNEFRKKKNIYIGLKLDVR